MPLLGAALFSTIALMVIVPTARSHLLWRERRYVSWGEALHQTRNRAHERRTRCLPVRCVHAYAVRSRSKKANLVTVLYRLLIAVVVITYPVESFLGWYAAGLRDLSLASWLPAALLLALFVFGALQCLVSGNIGAAALLSAVGLTFPAIKFAAAVRG